MENFKNVDASRIAYPIRSYKVTTIRFAKANLVTIKRFPLIETILGTSAEKARITAQSSLLKASATSATADGLAPEGASQTKKFCLQVIKKRPRKPDVADVHEWCSAATAFKMV
ncbi:hypothetical protein EVAR_94146_1 [Eumeta japonica]|uniref:Uncharacterized protein n=1 Tax=Eumeta variegata TaxID=151549 RepID=A0A4C1U8B6_EUMVA|nr:hypothetical protein EVAR_94146_1 [Eumeta japonica]